MEATAADRANRMQSYRARQSPNEKRAKNIRIVLSKLNDLCLSLIKLRDARSLGGQNADKSNVGAKRKPDADIKPASLKQRERRSNKSL